MTTPDQISDWKLMSPAELRAAGKSPTSMRYRNTRTGEQIARREYDIKYGLLARQGYESHEEKAELRKQLWHGWHRKSFAFGEALETRRRLLGDRVMFVSVYGLPADTYATAERGPQWLSIAAFHGKSKSFVDIISDLSEVVRIETIEVWVLRWKL